ncbi:hypothetical protein TNCV_3963301 [Trichonephila clavipes]|nr:hypothetical protein TNCV_3963301 [Trichonephila clavipes]
MGVASASWAVLHGFGGRSMKKNFFAGTEEFRKTLARNRDYTGMWVRLGSTDLMAGKVMFLRSNQGGRFDGNESVADSFRSDLVNFKSSCTTILGAFYSFFVCQKNPPLPGSAPATRVNPIRRSLPLSKLSSIQLCVT